MPYLLWHEDNRSEIDSVEELDRALDRLTAEAREDLPFAVQVCLDDRTAMLIVVGRDVSHVEFTSPTSRPLVVVCEGPWDDDELIELTHGGVWSELPRRYWVPISEAREAVRAFFRTGTRPNNIRWGTG